MERGNLPSKKVFKVKQKGSYPFVTTGRKVGI
jgi:hypothetical protein